MLVRTSCVSAEQSCSISVDDLPEIVVSRGRLRQAKRALFVAKCEVLVIARGDLHIGDMKTE
jgi:hypothetical protein